MSIAALVLAAGSGSRYGPRAEHKLLALLRGRPIAAWALASAEAGGLDELVVVTGAVDLADVLPSGTLEVRNDDWAAGQAGSLRAGIEACADRGHDAVVVGLADQPFVEASAWSAVAFAAGGPVVVATYSGRRRNPVRLDRPVWDLLPTSGDEGARALMRAQPTLVVEVACEGDPADVDTLEDLYALESAEAARGAGR